MKTYIGSLQRRRKRYYLVIHRDGHQRWLALKTEKLSLARVRAARIAPRDPDNERAWLEQLVREGELARIALSRLRATANLTWENLDEYAHTSMDFAINDNDRSGHGRWLTILGDFARRVGSGSSPATLSSGQALRVVSEMSVQYRSTPRMVRFFRRIWKDVGLNADIWPVRCPVSGLPTGERYRRLSLEEVRRAYAVLSEKDQALADMCLIGYSTGLRLSDVAELELNELDIPFLRVVPNKTRRCRPNPLRIPLTDEALAVVERLKLIAERTESDFLFTESVRHRPSRRIASAFRRAGVKKQGNGRASFHSLRATFISLMDEAGVPPHVTDAITGHGGGGMHARYTQPSDTALMSAVVRSIPPILDPPG